MIGLALVGCSAPGPVSDPALAGPYAVGATTVELTDPRGKRLTIEVWYPALPDQGPPGAYEPTVLSLTAVRDAEPVRDGAPWPVVGFSHGSVAIRFQSAFLTEHLASHGFVVIAPDHARNTLLDVDPSATADVLLERPDDVRHAVDGVVGLAGDGGLLGGLVEDGDRAVVGHSFGALTALLVGGGRPDLAGVQDYCAAGGDSPACDVVTDELLARVDELGPPDEQVVATVAMSPLAPYAFPNGGLGSVAAGLILGGEQDPVTPFDTDIQPVYDGLSAPRALLAFEGAGHYPFSDICLLVPVLFDECDPEAGFADPTEVQVHTRAAVTAWLQVHLVGDDRYSSFLAPEAWEGVPGVTLSSD